MSPRVRHCVACPRCQTYYLIAFSPYKNGAYLVRFGEGSGEEYVLYCFCEGTPFASRWRWRQVKECQVTRQAYDRGYGSIPEVRPNACEVRNEASADSRKYVHLRQS